MKIVRFMNEDHRVEWGRMADADHAHPIQGDLFGDHAFAPGAPGPRRMVRRLAPVEPPNIFAIGRNYRDHATEMQAHSDRLLAGATREETEPLVFLKATTSIIGPDDEIVLPSSAPDEVDFEAELGVVIGRRARDVSEADALQYVLGYTCANDLSARDCQKRRDKQWARGKSFDSFCPIGPVLVTADEIQPDRLAISSRLNGRVRQVSNTREMIFSVGFLVSYLSHQFTLLPGTLILTGTPAGVGAARTPPVFLRAGDEIAIEIEGIGTLCNRVRGPVNSGQ